MVYIKLSTYNVEKLPGMGIKQKKLDFLERFVIMYAQIVYEILFVTF